MGTGSALATKESAERLSQRVRTLWPRSLKHQGLEKTMPKGSKSAPTWHQNPPKSDQKVAQNYPKCVFGPGQGNVFEFAFSLIDLWSHFGSPLGHISTLLAHVWQQTDTLKPTCFFIRFWGELGRPHTQSAAAGWLQTHVGTLLKKSEFRRILHHFELQKCTEIDPGH